MIKIFVDTLAYTAETIVFIFLGIGVFTFEKKYEQVNAGTVILTLVNLNIARLLNVYITSYFVNKSRSEQTQITSKHMIVMWIAGLRGAMAYALAMESSHNRIFNDPSIGHHSGDVMLIVTILYSLYTILGVSSFLHPIMTRCGVTGGSAKV